MKVGFGPDPGGTSDDRMGKCVDQSRSPIIGNLSSHVLIPHQRCRFSGQAFSWSNSNGTTQDAQILADAILVVRLSHWYNC